MYADFEKDTYTRAIQVFGEEPQLMQMCEETAELISCLVDYSMITLGGCSKDEWMRGEHLYERNELIGERADVQIMLDQMIILFNDKKIIEDNIVEIGIKYIGGGRPDVNYMLKSAAETIKCVSKYRRVLNHPTSNPIEQEARVQLKRQDLRIARAHLQISLNSLVALFNDGRQVENEKSKKLLRLNEVMDFIESSLYKQPENTNESTDQKPS